MRDYLIRGLSDDISIRIFIATTTKMTEEARKIHNTSPAVTTAMGKFLTMAAMMGNNLKSDKDRLTIQLKADGPVGELVAVADGKGNIKAFPGNPEATAGKNHKLIMEELPDGTQASSLKSEYSMQALIGEEGTLTVIKDLGLKEPYIGKIPLADGSITGDFMAYFSVSEQTPTLIDLGTALDAEGKVIAAGGYMIQVLPGASEAEISAIETNLGNGLDLLDLLKSEKTPEEIAELIMKGLTYKLLSLWMHEGTYGWSTGQHRGVGVGVHHCRAGLCRSTLSLL